MTSNAYFEREVIDSETNMSAYVEIGTTGFGGVGPQMYLSVGSLSILLSHADARALCEAVEKVRGYLGFEV